jgi:hypothetical protein
MPFASASNFERTSGGSFVFFSSKRWMSRRRVFGVTFFGMKMIVAAVGQVV